MIWGRHGVLGYHHRDLSTCHHLVLLRCLSKCSQMAQPHSNDVHRNHRLGRCNKSAILTDNKRGITVLKMLISPFSPSFALGTCMWIILFLPASHHYYCILNSESALILITVRHENKPRYHGPNSWFGAWPSSCLKLPQACILSSPRQQRVDFHYKFPGRIL